MTSRRRVYTYRQTQLFLAEEELYDPLSERSESGAHLSICF